MADKDITSKIVLLFRGTLGELFKNRMTSFDESALIVFDQRHKRLLVVLAVFFVGMSIFGLHGFSLGYLSHYYEGLAPKDVVFGEMQGIRSDDWNGYLPTVIAQINHDPPFPVINKNVFDGQSMLFFPGMPVVHYFSLFRPTVWGYFAGIDFGLSWQWGCRLVGLVYVYFLLFSMLSANRFWLSLCAALSLTYSPFIQFWAMNSAELLIALGMCIVSVCFLVTRITKRSILLWGVALGYWGVAFALAIYPAYQVPLTYVFLLCSLTILLERYGIGWLTRLFGIKLVGILCSVIFLVGVLTHFFIVNSESIRLMSETAYPGARIDFGGGFSTTRLFSNSIEFFWDNRVVERMGNICEAASFYFIFPIGLVIAFFRGFAIKKWASMVPLTVLISMMLIWVLVGFYPDVAKYTGMYLTTTVRAQIALGIANLFVLVLAVKEPMSSWSINFNQRQKSIVKACMILAFIMSVAGVLILANDFKNTYDVPKKVVDACALFAIVISMSLFFHARLAPFLYAVLMISMTAKFNPLSRGFSDYLYSNEASALILQSSPDVGDAGKWVVFADNIVANLPRMLGRPSIGGLQYYPSDIWSVLDPEEKNRFSYNRYAHVNFAASVSQSASFFNPAGDAVTVFINPGSNALDTLGVRYFLAKRNDDEFQKYSTSLYLVASSKNWVVYRR